MSKMKEKAANQEPTHDEEKIDLEAKVLLGNTRDEILGLFKQKADWKTFKQAQQEEIVKSCEYLAREMIRKISNIIASRGFKAFHCTLESVMIKDGIKAVLKASKNAEGIDTLLRSQGGSVTVVLTDINPYLGQRNKPEIDKDEPSLLDEDKE